MLENPGDELYFGEVYRTVLQEAWLPAGAEEWQRTGLSRRGRRPTQQGLIPGTPTAQQAIVRQCFSRCVAAWNALPWDDPTDTTCNTLLGKEYWKKEKDDRGLMCSYYDVYMRYCLRHCLDTGCISPSNYSLSVHPILRDIKCDQDYNLTFSDKCGDVQMISGDGQFTPPGNWRSPKCGSEGTLCFTDANESKGFTTYEFDPAHKCTQFIWPIYNPGSITANDSKVIVVEGGVPPYKWKVYGTGFSVLYKSTGLPRNRIITDSSACGSATIEVEDTCGNQTQGLILCTVGVWVSCGSHDFYCWPTVLHEVYIGKWWLRWRCCSDWMSAGQGLKTIECPDATFQRGCPITISYFQVWQWGCSA